MSKFIIVLGVLVALLIPVEVLADANELEDTYVHGFKSLSQQEKEMVPVLITAGLFILIFIAAKPVYGLILSMCYFPFVPQSASGVSIPQFFAAVILLSYVLIWMGARNARTGLQKDYLGCERIFILFWIYLIINFLIGYLRGIPGLDIVRDAIAIANIIFFLSFKYFVKTRKNLALLVTIQFFLLALLGLKTSLGILPPFSFLAVIPYGLMHIFMLMLLLGSFSHLLFFKSKKTVFWILLLTTVMYFLLTPNRTSFIIALLSLGILLLLVGGERRIVAIGFIGVALCVALYFTLQSAESSFLQVKQERLVSIFSGNDLSIESRNDEASQCWDIFKQNPIFGVGIGYRYRFWRHYIGSGILEGYMVDNFTHSDLMWFLSKTGIVGTFLYLLFYMQICRLAWAVWKKAPEKKDRVYALVAFIFLIAVIIDGQSTPVLQVRTITALLGMVMGYVYSLYRLTVAAPREEREETVRA